MAEEQDGETTFSPTNSSKEHLNAEQAPHNNFWSLAEDIRCQEKQPIVFERKEKKSSSMHQNTDASFPNQETLTSQSSNPTHWEKPPLEKGTTDHQKERPPQTQQSTQDEKAEKYLAGKGTWKMPTKLNKRRRRQAIYLKKNLE